MSKIKENYGKTSEELYELWDEYHLARAVWEKAWSIAEQARQELVKKRDLLDFAEQALDSKKGGIK